jgi:hypothetical protein
VTERPAEEGPTAGLGLCQRLTPGQKQDARRSLVLACTAYTVHPWYPLRRIIVDFLVEPEEWLSQWSAEAEERAAKLRKARPLDALPCLECLGRMGICCRQVRPRFQRRFDVLVTAPMAASSIA